MRAVVQRAKEGKVTVNENTVSSIGPGLVVLLGVDRDDEPGDMDYMVNKITGLRIFPDENGKLNRSVADINGEILLVSQFTLLGDARNGRRPGFTQAARPEQADAMYLQIAERIRDMGIPLKTGQFQTEMEVHLINDGPVTILLDSHKTF